MPINTNRYDILSIFLTFSLQLSMFLFYVSVIVQAQASSKKAMHA